MIRGGGSVRPEGDTYIVLDDFGVLGRAWRETDEEGANRASLVRKLLAGGGSAYWSMATMIACTC
jgi:hypothetical protein